jgi:hypothetical protein
MKRSKAIRYLIVTGIMWVGSIPWVIYLAASRQIPWSVPLICTPIYVFLYWGALKAFWPHVRKPGAE